MKRQRATGGIRQALRRAQAHFEAGRLGEAELGLLDVLERAPDNAVAMNDLGNVLLERRRLREAVERYREALAIRPDWAVAHGNLGIALMSMGRLAEAVGCYRQALMLDPGYAKAHSMLIFALDLEERSTAELQQERRHWNEQHARGKGGGILGHANRPDPERRLRIGYVSGDFRLHSALLVFGSILRLHDTEHLEVVCYSQVNRADPVTERVRACADVWRQTHGLSDDALAEQIRRDRIDILMDLSGHTGGNRLLVFARKPAPVQVTAWGYALGTGVEAIDYFFADPVLVPTEARALFAETVVDLPCFVCFEPPAYLPEVSDLPALAGQPFTFGCINRVQKFSDRIIGLWSRILAAMPDSRLLIKDKYLDESALREDLLARLGRAGIAPARVVLEGGSPHLSHLKTFARVDLGLDSYPHGGGVSTLEALWMGVPVVTLQGVSTPSRLSAAILSAMKLEDGIARSDEDYVRMALGAAANLQRLREIRLAMRSYVQASVVGDVARYTRAVESAYRAIWKTWCEQARGGRAGGAR